MLRMWDLAQKTLKGGIPLGLRLEPRIRREREGESLPTGLDVASGDLQPREFESGLGEIGLAGTASPKPVKRLRSIARPQEE